MSRVRWGVGVALGAGLAGVLLWSLWPGPMAVDLGAVERGPMQVTLAAEGMTRVREPHTITAPIAGTTGRAPVEVGDEVVQGETLVAVIRPIDPALMDARSRAQAEAALLEAEAALRLTEAHVVRAEAARDHAGHQLERGRGLARAGTMAQRMLEDLEQGFELATQSFAAALAERDLAAATLERARAQLIGPADIGAISGAPGECCMQIFAPLSGVVLEIADRNARQVISGTPLMTLGDLADLEIETDLLSVDAVRITPGAPARIERWGGPETLVARVRRIEPSAFTRVSALGIEEQRVRVQLELLSPPEDRPRLGERFRVFVRIVLWEGDDLLQVPSSALFRHADGWAVFREIDGRAVLAPVAIGQQSGERTEVLEGLGAGDRVVLYPARALADGGRIVSRER